jgi:hypothetical protein
MIWRRKVVWSECDAVAFSKVSKRSSMPKTVKMEYTANMILFSTPCILAEIAQVILDQGFRLGAVLSPRYFKRT